MAKQKPIFTIQPKRHKGDCAVSALASLLNVKYEEVLVAAAKMDNLVLVNGLNTKEMIRLAAAFGKRLELQFSDDIDYMSTGILGIAWKETWSEHALLMSHGLVFDPDDGEVWMVEGYLRRYKAKVIDFLELED